MQTLRIPKWVHTYIKHYFFKLNYYFFLLNWVDSIIKMPNNNIQIGLDVGYSDMLIPLLGALPSELELSFTMIWTVVSLASYLSSPE